MYASLLCAYATIFNRIPPHSFYARVLSSSTTQNYTDMFYGCLGSPVSKISSGIDEILTPTARAYANITRVSHDPLSGRAHSSSMMQNYIDGAYNTETAQHVWSHEHQAIYKRNYQEQHNKNSGPKRTINYEEQWVQQAQIGPLATVN